jgi:hypothetical protein
MNLVAGGRMLLLRSSLRQLRRRGGATAQYTTIVNLTLVVERCLHMVRYVVQITWMGERSMRTVARANTIRGSYFGFAAQITMCRTKRRAMFAL